MAKKKVSITKVDKKGKEQFVELFENLVTQHPKKSEIPVEQDYLDSTEYLPYSTALRADVYLKLKRLEYWSRTPMKDIIENSLLLAFEHLTDSEKELPVGERAKLKQLKTAKDYYNENKKGKKE